MVHYEVIAFLPIYIIIEYVTKNAYYSRLFFTSTISLYASFEIINKQYYTIEAINNLDEYNIVAEKCILICLLYFCYDMFDKESYSDLSFLIHHFLGIIGTLCVIHYKIFGILSLYLCCHEISTIFLNLKYLNIYKNFANKMFIVSFVCVRLTTLPVMVFKTYYKNKIIFLTLLTDSGLHIFWIIKLIKSKRKKIKFIYNKKDSNLSHLIENGDKKTD